MFKKAKTTMFISTKLFNFSVNNSELTIKPTDLLPLNNINSTTKYTDFNTDELQDVLFNNQVITNAIYNCLSKIINILATERYVKPISYYTLFNSKNEIINNTDTTFTFYDINKISDLVNIIEKCDNVLIDAESLIDNDSIINNNSINNYYTVLYKELIELIKITTGNNEIDFTLYKYGDITLLNYFDMRDIDNWNMLKYLITQCINSKSIDNVFKPRPDYIDSFTNFNNVFTQKSLSEDIKYFDSIIKFFVSLENKERYGSIDKEKQNLYTNLEYYMYQFNPVAYDIIITSLNNFNMYNLSQINKSSIGLPDSVNATIFKVESNDIELEQKFNDTISKLPAGTNTHSYHGSYITNWYSILFNGLYTPSASDYLMANANVYGKGIYLSNSFNFSLYYCKNSDYKIMGVFQTINDLEKYKKTNSIYVVGDSNDLILRYIIYFKSNDIQSHTSLYKKIDKYFINSNTDSNIEQKISRITTMNKKGARRIMKEIKELIHNSGVKDNDYNLEYEFIADDDKLNVFNIKMATSNFKDCSKLYHDLVKKGIEYIDFEIRLPQEYPFKPPFIRIIYPRFKYMTGHITLGGSVCMEILTNQNWIVSLMIPKVMLMIIQNMISGGAELDPKAYNKPYSYEEAISAYKRMLVSHREWK